LADVKFYCLKKSAFMIDYYVSDYSKDIAQAGKEKLLCKLKIKYIFICRFKIAYLNLCPVLRVPRLHQE